MLVCHCVLAYLGEGDAVVDLLEEDGDGRFGCLLFCDLGLIFFENFGLDLITYVQYYI